MKILLTILGLFSTITFANEEGKEYHEESCVACHIVHHDDAFYTRKDRKNKTYGALVGQVSRCRQAFNVDWFPDEEQTVVDYLNALYYQYDNPEAAEAPKTANILETPKIPKTP